MSGAYPTLYANGQEYGNYIAANPIVLANPVGIPNHTTHELMVFSNEDHCPLVNVGVGVNYNLGAVRFDVVNNHLVQPLAPLAGAAVVPPTPQATSAEEDLLRQYGKVFYYQVEFGTSRTNFTNGPYLVLAYEDIVNLDPVATEWLIVPEFFNPLVATKDVFGVDLYYNMISSSGPSYEVIVDFNAAPVVHKDQYFPAPMNSRKFTTQSFHSWGIGGSAPANNIFISFE